MKQSGYRIALIVEGDGEMKAVPNLVSRWLKEQGIENCYPQKQVICAYGSDRLKKDIERFIGVAVANQPDAILIILDADSIVNCPKLLGPKLLARAEIACPHIPVGVVLAYKEYESWFLHILPELQRAGKVLPGVTLPVFNNDDEMPRGCKEELGRIMGRKYKERIDQPDFTRYLPFSEEMRQRSRSYRHLLDTLARLVQTMQSVD